MVFCPVVRAPTHVQSPDGLRGGSAGRRTTRWYGPLETIVALTEIKDESYYRVLAYRRTTESIPAFYKPVVPKKELVTSGVVDPQ